MSCGHRAFVRCPKISYFSFFKISDTVFRIKFPVTSSGGLKRRFYVRIALLLFIVAKGVFACTELPLTAVTAVILFFVFIRVLKGVVFVKNFIVYSFSHTEHLDVIVQRKRIPIVGGIRDLASITWWATFFCDRYRTRTIESEASIVGVVP